MHITKSLVLPLSLLLWVFSTSVSVSAIPVGSDFQRRADSSLSDKVHEPDLHPQGEPMDVDTVDTVQVILALDESETISQALTRADEVQALQGFWDRAKSEERPVIEGVLKLLKKEAVLRAISFERSGPLRVPARIQNAVSVFFSRRFGFQTLALFGPESVYKEMDPTKGLILFCRQPVPLSAERKEGGEVVGKEDKTEYVWAKYNIRRKPKRNAVPSAEDQSPEDKGVKGLGPGASTKSVEESGISSQEVSGEQIHDDGSSTRVEKPGEPEGGKPDSLNRPPPLPQEVSGNQRPEGGRSTQLEKPGKPKGEKLERLNQPPPLPQKTSGKENVDSDSSDELEPGELREERKDDRVTGPPLPQQNYGGQKYNNNRSTRLGKPGEPDRRNPNRLDRPGPYPKWVGNSYRSRYGPGGRPQRNGGGGYGGSGNGGGGPRRDFDGRRRESGRRESGRRESGRIDSGRSQPIARNNYWRPQRRPQ